MKLSLPVISKDVIIVHRMKNSGEPHHGKMHTLLVPALEEFFSCLEEPCLKKSPSSETLKTASFPYPQTTHSQQVHRIRCLLQCTLNLEDPGTRQSEIQNVIGGHRSGGTIDGRAYSDMDLERSKHDCTSHCHRPWYIGGNISR